MALLRGPALEPGPSRPPLIGHRGTAQPSVIELTGRRSRRDRLLAMPAEQARPQGRTRGTPQDLVLPASFRGDPVDVVLGCVRVADPPVPPSTRGGSPDSQDSCPVVPCSWHDATHAINPDGRRRLVEVSHLLVRVHTQTATRRGERHAPDHRYGRIGLPRHPRPRGCRRTIRLVPETRTNGQGGISLEAIDEPAPADAEAHAQGVRLVVAQELASTLDDAVLDAKPTEQGTEFFIRSQPA